MAPVENEQNEPIVRDVEALRPARDWLWRPWYAKLWWAAIPIYWLGMAASSEVSLLSDFYHSALAGLLNVLFFPPIALMVLGVGYARRWFPPLDEAEVVDADTMWLLHQQRLSVGGLRDPYSDPLDPKSGALHLRHIGVLKQ